MSNVMDAAQRDIVLHEYEQLSPADRRYVNGHLDGEVVPHEEVISRKHAERLTRLIADVTTIRQADIEQRANNVQEALAALANEPGPNPDDFVPSKFRAHDFTDAEIEDINAKEAERLIAKQPKTTSKQDVLDAAGAAVADRGLNYGKPEANFQRIANLWNAHLSNRFAEGYGGDTTVMLPTLTPVDIAMMMALMKLARTQHMPSHMDSWIDLAGYAACGGEIAAKG